MVYAQYNTYTLIRCVVVRGSMICLSRSVIYLVASSDEWIMSVTDVSDYAVFVSEPMEEDGSGGNKQVREDG